MIKIAEGIYTWEHLDKADDPHKKLSTLLWRGPNEGFTDYFGDEPATRAAAVEKKLRAALTDHQARNLADATVARVTLMRERSKRKLAP